MKSHAELTKRQLQVLPYLLVCGTYEEAARQAKISVKQIYCWLRTSAFKKELDRRRNEIIEEAVNKLKYNTSKAADTLISLLSHSNPMIQRGVANGLAQSCS
ncbi:hypothetical protein [Parachlamydia acanthamoebae]|uniref:hypothetical protein n=1 Tax=Parachlamydia acanthamoebae TaxID=83552 RepID=UPI000AA3ECEE|nr:hypothetical protein [Parachlamydia acanthamoebae]